MTDIAQLGYAVDSSQLTRGTVELDKHSAAAQRTGAASAKLEKDFRRLRQAEADLTMLNRQLPMQFTDIAVGIATGQRPMYILLQQGGQLKDLAGGIVPALKAMAGYVYGLINPFTLAAGAAAVLVAAWADAEADSTAFNRALLLTGNYANKSNAQLEAMVDSLSDLQGVTKGGARDALLQVAQTGRFTGETFDMVAQAAARMEASAGQSVEDTVKKFESIAKDPVKALLKLNETEHFLTQAQLDRVDALVKEGKEQDAAAYGAEAYAGRLNDIADAAERARPHLSSMWQEAKQGASDAWEATKDFAEFLAAAGQKFEQMSWWKKLSPTGGMLSVIKALRSAEPAAPVTIPLVAGAVDSKAAEAAEKARQDAARDFEQFRSNSLAKAVKLEEQIKKMRAAGVLLGKQETELAKVEAEMRARYAESLPKGRKKEDPTDALVKRLQDQIALNKEAAASDDRLTATERMLVQVRTELERIGAKGSATNKALIATLIEQAKASDAAAVAAEKQRKAEEALAQLKERTALAEQNRQRSNQADLAELTGSGEAAQMLRRQLDIHRWYEDQVAELRRQAAREKRDVTAGEEAELKASLDRQLEAERLFQQRRQALMGDWRVGADRALDAYRDKARDIASQVEDIWAEGLNTLEDLGVDALTNNLDDWQSYFDNLDKMILRFIIRQQLTKWMDGVHLGGGSGGSGSSGWVSDFLGALFGGGRASGGDVRGDRVYQVGERNRPELATIGGAQYLIPGDRGRVDPIGGGTARTPAAITVEQHFHTIGRIDPRTAAQQQQQAAVKLRLATSRNS